MTSWVTRWALSTSTHVPSRRASEVGAWRTASESSAFLERSPKNADRKVEDEDETKDCIAPVPQRQHRGDADEQYSVKNGEEVRTQNLR